VNVQLIDAESGNHLWAERFDKSVADLFDMQDEIVSRLANALDDQLLVGSDAEDDVDAEHAAIGAKQTRAPISLHAPYGLSAHRRIMLSMR
jgi:hypothetical protein